LRGLARRLERAEQALRALTPPPTRGQLQWDDPEGLQAEVQAILKQRRVEELLEVNYIREVQRRPIRKYRDRPARTEGRVRYVIQVKRNPATIREVCRLMSWRLYATTALKERSHWLKRYGCTGAHHGLSETSYVCFLNILRQTWNGHQGHQVIA